MDIGNIGMMLLVIIGGCTGLLTTVVITLGIPIVSNLENHPPHYKGYSDHKIEAFCPCNLTYHPTDFYLQIQKTNVIIKPLKRAVHVT